MKNKTTVKIYSIIILVVVFLFARIIFQLCYIVLSEKVDGISLKDKAASISTVSKTLYANRGNIYDVNGEVLAETVNSYTLVAYLSPSRTTDMSNPKHVIEKEKTAKILSEYINMSEENILTRLKKDKYQVELARGITELDKATIDALELPGIGFISYSKKRYYNKGTFASYIIGYTKEYEKDGERKLVGELGIEGYKNEYIDFNEILSGKNGYTNYLKYTSNNYRIPNTPEDTKEAVNGSDIYLTIDSNIQLMAEQAVSKIKKQYNSEWGMFIVMDANTGAIVASATSPNFNPNDLNTLVTAGYMNPLLSESYEPGSVMKIFSFASAIEEGKYSETEKYKSGSYTLKDGTVIRDSNRTGWGTITFDEGFAHSSNVAATTLALRVGTNKLQQYYTKLGFGKPVGIELANEATGMGKMVGLYSDNNHFIAESELATSSFGQGIGVTAIQMLQALSSMTNDGSTIKPYIVDRIVDADGNVTYQGGRQVVEKVYSTSTVKKMHELMHDVIALNTFWKPENVSVMGKTGTAQIASKKGGYLNGPYDYVRSFAGIFPEDNPKYIVYAVVKKAETTQRGWSQIVKTTIEEIASYAKVSDIKSDVDKDQLIKIDNYISKDTQETLNRLENINVKPVVIGDGKYIINQYPLKNASILANSKLFLVTNGNQYTMKDLEGWSLSEVKNYCALLGLKLETDGYGYVVNQSIEKDSIVDIESMILKVELKK